MYFLGYDIGSSFIKASLLDGLSGAPLGTCAAPEREMAIRSVRPGWAEQEPETWWDNIAAATGRLAEQTGADLSLVRGIGISYQMHGLVIVDKSGDVLRPAIIWCDSRAIEAGREALEKLGEECCLQSFLNFPGNFTASKLKWVKENEPDVFARVHKAMLPGDYIAFRLTDRIATTVPGLSEGILWHFQKMRPAFEVLEAFGIAPEVLPEIVPTFGFQGELTAQAARRLGLPAGIPVAYRAGDQPNNALSLSVLEPGDAATTAGTSGVVYAVNDKPVFDRRSRVNAFVHVNHSPETPRYGTLMCINGCGIALRWLKETAGGGASYDDLNALAASVPPGAEGLCALPYGNGAERTLSEKNPGCSFSRIDFNLHGRGHLVRAVQEGIVFGFALGFEIMKTMGILPARIRAGHANLFLSPVFREAFVNTLGVPLSLYETDGSQGAARGAGIGAGHYKTPADAFCGLVKMCELDPAPALEKTYQNIYARWKECLGTVDGAGL